MQSGEEVLKKREEVENIVQERNSGRGATRLSIANERRFIKYIQRDSQRVATLYASEEMVVGARL